MSADPQAQGGNNADRITALEARVAALEARLAAAEAHIHPQFPQPIARPIGGYTCAVCFTWVAPGLPHNCRVMVTSTDHPGRGQSDE